MSRSRPASKFNSREVYKLRGCFTQGVQQRKFKYDDLGRLTRQKLAEQTATLNDSGVYIGAGQAGANWANAFFYDNRSNLTQKTDARGVKAHSSGAAVMIH